MPVPTPPARLEGGCLCGAVRYALDEPPGLAEYCHCSRCRKAHGSAFSTNAVVAASAFELTQGREALREFAPSPTRRRHFCGLCGSPLYISRLNAPEIVVLALGSLDDHPAIQPPERHVFTASKAAWHEITDTLARWDVYPGAEPEDA